MGKLYLEFLTVIMYISTKTLIIDLPWLTGPPTRNSNEDEQLLR
jgi:hypothetical protein